MRELSDIFVGKVYDLSGNRFLVVIQFIYMGKALSEFCRLLAADRSVDGSLYFLNRMLAEFVHERCSIKGHTVMIKDMSNDQP